METLSFDWAVAVFKASPLSVVASVALDPSAVNDLSRSDVGSVFALSPTEAAPSLNVVS